MSARQNIGKLLERRDEFVAFADRRVWALASPSCSPGRVTALRNPTTLGGKPA